MASITHPLAFAELWNSSTSQTPPKPRLFAPKKAASAPIHCTNENHKHKRNINRKNVLTHLISLTSRKPKRIIVSNNDKTCFGHNPLLTNGDWAQMIARDHKIIVEDEVTAWTCTHCMENTITVFRITESVTKPVFSQGKKTKKSANKDGVNHLFRFEQTYRRFSGEGEERKRCQTFKVKLAGFDDHTLSSITSAKARDKSLWSEGSDCNDTACCKQGQNTLIREHLLARVTCTACLEENHFFQRAFLWAQPLYGSRFSCNLELQEERLERRWDGDSDDDGDPRRKMSFLSQTTANLCDRNAD